MTVLAYMASAIPDLVFGKVAFDEVCQAIADLTPALDDDYVLDAAIEALVTMREWSVPRAIDDSQLMLAAKAIAERLEELEPPMTDPRERFFATFPSRDV
jgi:hypothetical protein